MSTTAPHGPSTPPVRLPVWGLIAASFASVFSHLDNLAGRIWPWVVISCGLAIVFGGVLHMRLDVEDPQQWEKEQWVALGVMFLPMIVGSVMVVVNWHRGLLLGEAGGTAAAFRFDRSFWRYVGVALRFFLVYAALIIPLAVVFGVRAAINAPEPSPSVDTALNYALMLAVLPFSARCLLAFPMAAIGAKPPLLRGSWRMMRGNTWRLAGALFVVEIFGYVLNYLVDAAARFLAGLMGMETSVDIITWPINTAIVLLNVALGASLASYAYAVLTNHPLGREVTG